MCCSVVRKWALWILHFILRISFYILQNVSIVNNLVSAWVVPQTVHLSQSQKISRLTRIIINMLQGLVRFHTEKTQIHLHYKFCQVCIWTKLWGELFLWLFQELPSPDTVLKETLYLFFQQSSQLSEAWNPLMLIFLASSLAFVFRIDADTTIFLLLTVRCHLKMRSSKCANVLLI